MTAWLVSLFDPAAPSVIFLNIVAKSTIIFLVAATVNVFLQRVSASVRHWVWTLAFLGIILTPFLSSFTPQKTIALPETAFEKSAPVKTSKNESPPRTETKFQRKDSAETAQHPAPSTERPAQPIADFQTLDAKSVFFTIWLAGAALLLLRLLFDLSVLAFISHRGARPRTSAWSRDLRVFKSRLNIKRTIRIATSSVVEFPLTAGVFRPVILIPEHAEKWDAEQRQMTLQHELAHIKRFDFLSNILAQMVCAALWFHPLAWFAKRRLQIEREKACDDYVLRSGARWNDYASCLVEIARKSPFRQKFAPRVVGMAHQAELKIRLKSILKPGTPRRGLSVAASLSTAAFALGVMLSLAFFKLEKTVASIAGDVQDQVSEFNVKNDSALASHGFDTRSFASLSTALKHKSPDVRAEATLALGELHDERAIKNLVAMLKDDNAQVRASALNGLAQFGKRKNFHDVLPFVLAKGPKVRAASMNVLSAIGCEPAFIAISHLLDDENPKVRAAAVRGLRPYERWLFSKPLFHFEKEQASINRRSLSKVIPRFDSRSAQEMLEDLLENDPSPAVRQEVVEVLHHQGIIIRSNKI